MKKLNNIKVSEILTPAQMINVKGGNTLTVSVVLDDKRRDRPGGGITTL